MRIISRTADFYDTALGYGEDPSRVYVREPHRVAGMNEPFRNMIATAPQASRFYGHAIGAYAVDDGFTPNLLLFCGKAYPFIEHDERSYASWPALGEQVNHLWSAEQVHATMERRLPTRALPDYERPHRARAFTHAAFVRGAIDEFFGRLPSDREIMEAHTRHRSPVVLYGVSRHDRALFTEVDPVLRDVGFFRVKDPFQTFQEISGFIGGVMAEGGRARPEVPGPIRFLKRGFDALSFRRRGS